jgi:hypothetical protein
VPAWKVRPSGVVNTLSGQPSWSVKAPAAVMSAASTSGCSSRSTLIATNPSLRRAASAGSENVSRAMTWHQWQVA